MYTSREELSDMWQKELTDESGALAKLIEN